MASNIPYSEIKDILIEQLPYKIMWMDKIGRIIYGNEQFCKRLGYKASEITKLSIFDINPNTTQESWEKHWNEVKTKREVNFKSVHQTKKGKYYNVEVFAQFFSNNGKETICAIVNDITESSFYKNLLNHAERMTNVGGWKLNLQDGSLIVTEQVLCIFETDNNEDLLPGNVIHLFKESDHIKKMLSDIMRNGTGYDETLQLKNGKYIRCVTEAERKKNKTIKIVGTYQDVTEAVNQTKALDAFKDIIENTKDMIYFSDDEFKYNYCNKAALEYLNKSREQVWGQPIQKFYPNITKDEMNYIHEQVMAQGYYAYPFVYTDASGTRYYDCSGIKIEYESKEQAAVIVRDITELRQNALNLENTLQELSELKNELEIDNQYLREEISDKINVDNIICKSEAYLKVLELVTQVAITDATVLITGESGTGKELLASAVHMNSSRKDKTLIKVNCATLPKELIESELFGHKKGAFTGAISDKIGKFSLADGGTIFLDEIGEIPLDLQSKLLRVLQEGEFDQLGATTNTKVDVRIIAATNRNLQSMVSDGSFRQDLYYRLNVFPIENIPLRARKEDIPLLAQFFLEKYSAKAGKAFKRLSKKTISKLMEYSFPGNIRELENLIERAVIIENGMTLQPGSWLPTENGKIDSEEFKTIDVMQRDYIIKVLEHTNWRVSGPKGAAVILGIKDKTLFARMKKLGIEKQVSLKK